MTEITQRQVDAARKEAEEAYVTYANLKAQMNIAEADWLKKSRRFKNLDYQLAEIDGRLKKIASADKEKKPTKVPELTIDQLKSIADKLGFSITIEEPEEENEEVIAAIMEDNA